MSVFPKLHCQLSSVKSILLLRLSQCLNTYALLILLMALTLLTLFVTSIHSTHVEIQRIADGETPITLPFILLQILMLEIAMLLYFFLTNHLQLQKSIVIVMLLGLCVRIFYLSYTPYNVRMYDVGEHL